MHGCRDWFDLLWRFWTKKPEIRKENPFSRLQVCPAIPAEALILNESTRQENGRHKQRVSKGIYHVYWAEFRSRHGDKGGANYDSLYGAKHYPCQPIRTKSLTLDS